MWFVCLSCFVTEGSVESLLSIIGIEKVETTELYASN